MSNAVAISMSILLMLLTVSCKEEKTETSQKEVKATEPVKLPVRKQLTPEEKRLKDADKKLGWVMQDFDVPEYKLDRLHKKDEILTEDYVKYSSELIEASESVKDIDHPDEKLMGFAGKMLEAMATYEAALKSEDKDKVKNSWESLKNACATCHKDFRKDTGGY